MRTTMKEFIKTYREELDEIIQGQSPGAPKNDSERRLWILNNEALYLWAKSEGVPLD